MVKTSCVEHVISKCNRGDSVLMANELLTHMPSVNMENFDSFVISPNVDIFFQYFHAKCPALASLDHLLGRQLGRCRILLGSRLQFIEIVDVDRIFYSS